MQIIVLRLAFVQSISIPENKAIRDDPNKLIKLSFEKYQSRSMNNERNLRRNNVVGGANVKKRR